MTTVNMAYRIIVLEWKMVYQGFLLVMVLAGLPGHSTSQYYRDARPEGNYESEIVCEAGTAVLRCDAPGEVLRVKSLFYGREKGKDSICNKNFLKQDTCEMTGSDKKEKEFNLKKACNNKRECSVIASDFTFGDRQKCPSVTKYLHIIFACVAYTPTTTEQPTTRQILPGPPSTALPPTQTATQPASQEEFYINHHRLDENGHEWPKPRRIEKCNQTDDVDDDVMDDFSAASSIFVHVRVVIVTLISVLFTFSFA